MRGYTLVFFAISIARSVVVLLCVVVDQWRNLCSFSGGK